jgi:hypothetical protein
LKRACVAAAVLLVALGVAGSAQAIRGQKGDVVVSFEGGISPRALPRGGTAPVAVSISSSFKSAEGVDPPPQLRTISVSINRRGKIFDRGLPTCRVREIQPTTIRAAKRICGGAIVGRGHIEARVRLDNQPPFVFKGPMLVFHAERASGERRLLAQVYGLKPPSAFVLSFRIVKQSGQLGTVIKTSLPASASEWAYVTHFDMKLRRLYSYRGKQRSYVNAGCPAPPGFTIGLYRFAKGTFGFADGTEVSAELVRECAVER